jgi:hypothetical protein
MSQPPGGHYRKQPQGQPPWASGPSAGYPPTGQQGVPPSGYRASQAPLPPRARHKRPRKRNVILLAIAAFFVVGIIANALGANGKSAEAPTAATSSVNAVKAPSSAASRASAVSKAIAKAEDACYKRPPASGDIYVRTITPGVSPQAQQLGGGWAWDHASNKCLTSAQMVMATAPVSSGNCTQVGYVADNPGYDPNTTVAAPLMHVAAQKGPACQAVALSTPAQTTPAAAPAPPASTAPVSTTPTAAPAPPASTAPASCHPLSDEGTCYEPGEYCRDADHGMSGVAGNGEAITCEDNDGWRWEPA